MVEKKIAKKEPVKSQVKTNAEPKVKKPKAQIEKKGKNTAPKDKAREKLKERIKNKSKPVFRGAFGQMSVRKVKSKKWDKWRVPRGHNHWGKRKRKQEDGCWPKTGYRTDKDIRFMHPSGYMEIIINNPNELLTVDKNTHAIKIARTVGKRKRIEIKNKANELGLKLLNF